MTFLPRVGAAPPELPSSIHGLTRSVPATDGRALVEGRLAHVVSRQRAAGGRIRFPRVGTVTEYRVDLGTPANVVLSPGLLRRDFVGSEGVCVESLVVAPELPLVVCQYGGSAPLIRPLELTIHLDPHEPYAHDPDAPEADGPDAVRIEQGRDACAVYGAVRGIAIAAWPPPAAITVTATERGAHVRVVPADDGLKTLAVAGGNTAEVAAAVGAATHIVGHAVRAAHGPVEDGLLLATGVEEIDDGWAWLRARLRGLVDREGPAGGVAARSRRLGLGLAAQVAGDEAAAAAALSDERWRGSAEEALLAGRQASVFGDVARATAVARAWASVDGHPLRDLAGRALAEGLHLAVATETLADLRRTSRPAGSRTLPMVGRPAPPSWAGWLETLFAGSPVEPPASDDALVAAVHAMAARFVVSPSEAWTSWRLALAEGLDQGPRGPATWEDDGDRAGPEPSVTAALVLALGHGLLGLSPDAPTGRLRIAPRFPPHLASLGVDGIRVGDATFRLDYERSPGERHLFRLEPTSGGVPPVVVFEPSVGGDPTEIRIDGEPADLSVTRNGPRTTVAVQLPLDAPRSVEIVSP